MRRARAFFVCAGLLCVAGVLLPAAARAQAPVFLFQWGTLGSGDGQFVYPFGVAVYGGGRVYVTDSGNQRVEVFTSSGTYLTQWGTLGSGDGQLHFPTGVAVDGTGNVYVADRYNHRIQKFTGDGTYLTKWGTLGYGDGQFENPEGVAVDSDGNVYVSDIINHRIQKFTGDGTYLTQWGTRGNGDGQFYAPYGVGIDGGGNVYVADMGNNRIEVFTSGGSYLTQWGARGSGDGQFYYPYGVAVDGDGHVFVADSYNYRIQESTPTGTYLTAWGTKGSGDGQFFNPAGVAVDGSGKVYVADSYNHRIQVFAPLSRDVRVDVRPGDEDNVVNPGAHGVLPVAILSEPDFDATTVDPLSVRLAGASVRMRPHGGPMAWARDVDGDGRADLLLHVESDELALAPGDTVANLTGEAPNHQVVRGSDRVRVVGGGHGPPKRLAQPVANAPGTAPSLLAARVMPDGRVLASVRLAAEGEARLDLIDLAGRRLDTVRLEGGSLDGKECALGAGALSPGIYWVRLEQGANVRVARAVVLR